MYWGIREQGV